MRPASILFVSTDGEVIGAVRRVVSKMGHRLHVASSLEEIRQARLGRAWDTLLLQTDGLDQRTIRHAMAWHSDNGAPVIALARHRSIPDAVRSISAGASEYLPVHPMNRELFQEALEQALSKKREPAEDRPSLARSSLAEGVLSADNRMREIWNLLCRVADTKSPLLLSGESGTGKTILARAVHHRSCRRSGPFVEVSCGSLPETLLESELFGHARGAFTTAYYDRAGKFEAADGGTILLDEIGSASPRLQSRLLRILDSGEFERIGETTVRRADVRLIASTNVSLQGRVEAGRFREDLYHRLSGIHVALPSLRERVCDIPFLARHFLREFAQHHQRPVREISADALDLIVHYHWPGNVRELKNVMEYGVIMAPGERLTVSSLPRRLLEQRAGGAGDRSSALLPLREALRDPERHCILRALELAGGNKQHAATELGISRSTLYKKLKELGLDSDAHASEASPRHRTRRARTAGVNSS